MQRFCKNKSFLCSTYDIMGSQPSIPSAKSVLVRVGNLWTDLAARRVNFSSLSISDIELLCHNSAP